LGDWLAQKLFEAKPVLNPLQMRNLRRGGLQYATVALLHGMARASFMWCICGGWIDELIAGLKACN
jgi:hypothetical protein